MANSLKIKIPITREVRLTIEKADPGRFWTLSDFPNLPPRQVAAVLATLYARGTLRRYGHGLYYAPKKTLIGEAPPAPVEIATKLARGERIVMAGLSAYNYLGLSTQVPARPIVATNKKLGTNEVEVLLRDLNRYGDDATDEAIMFLDAAGHIANIPDCPPRKAIENLRAILENRKLVGVTPNELARLALRDRPGVRGMIGLLGDLSGGLSETWRRRLKASLNPLTKFKLHLPTNFVAPETLKEWHFV